MLTITTAKIKQNLTVIQYSIAGLGDEAISLMKLTQQSACKLILTLGRNAGMRLMTANIFKLLLALGFAIYTH